MHAGRCGSWEYLNSDQVIYQAEQIIKNSMKNTKFSVITGVAGTIGSNLASELIKLGHIVYGIDDFSLGKKKI